MCVCVCVCVCRRYKYVFGMICDRMLLLFVLYFIVVGGFLEGGVVYLWIFYGFFFMVWFGFFLYC